MSLIYLSGAWIIGIILGQVLLESGFRLSPWWVFIVLFPVPLLFITVQHWKPVVLTVLCLFISLSGVIYFQWQLPTADENCLQFYNGEGAAEIKGLLDRYPEVGSQTTRLHLSGWEIKLDGEWKDVSGTALLFVPRYPQYNYGDVLLIRGKLNGLSQLGDPEYASYLAHQEIYSTMFYPDIDLVEIGQGFKPLEWIYSLRDHLSRNLAEVLPEPASSLAQGIVLGIRGNIPSSVKADFVHSGVAHLLAISGLHLSIVAGIMLSLGIWLAGRRHYIYIWLALITIWLYALLTGMQPPVFRAAIMVSLFLTAELLGRQRSIVTALLFAAALMVGISPQILWTASFQMSFAAMAGLVFIFPLIQSWFRKAVSAVLRQGALASAAGFITDSFSVSLGAIIAVWPLIAYYFGIISPVAPLTTLLALPVLPGIIITGALTGVTGLFFLPAAQVIAWLAWLLLSYVLLVVRGLAAVPYIETGSVGVVMVWTYYSLLALAIWFYHGRERLSRLMPQATGFVSSLPRKWVISPLLAVAVLVCLAVAVMPDDDLHVSFLDVGQGDAILIRRGRQQILVDGGPDPQAIGLELSREMPFWDRTIDLVILTHPSADHVTGLVEVLNRYRVNQVLYPGLDFQSQVYNEWLDLLKEKNIENTLALAGQEIGFGSEVTIEVLNPRIHLLTGTESDIDNNGMVVRLIYGEVSFLLTADTMWEAEFELIARRAGLSSTVLKAGHHGSATSTTAEFLDVVNPRVAVISVGTDNKFGHPNEEVLDRLQQRIGRENVYRTDQHGTIEFITDGERLWVEVEK